MDQRTVVTQLPFPIWGLLADSANLDVYAVAHPKRGVRGPAAATWPGIWVGVQNRRLHPRPAASILLDKAPGNPRARWNLRNVCYMCKLSFQQHH